MERSQWERFENSEGLLALDMFVIKYFKTFLHNMESWIIEETNCKVIALHGKDPGAFPSFFLYGGNQCTYREKKTAVSVEDSTQTKDQTLVTDMKGKN